MPKEQTIRRVDNISRLVQFSGAGKHSSFEIYKDQMKIGRSDECDIVLPHESVSRVHALVEKNGDLGYLIFDNESKNGVFLNGARVDASPLRNGDSIQVGVFGFKFHGPEGEALPHNLEVVPDKVESKSLIAKLFKNQDLSKYSIQSGNNKRLWMYGAVGVLLCALLVYKPADDKKEEAGDASASPGKSEAAKFSDKPKIADVGKAKKLDPTFEDPLDATKKVLTNPDLKDSNLMTSEQYFKSGLREFSNKNYQRAIDNFKSSLTFATRHPLAKYYLDLSIYESEAAAKRNRDLAIQYYRTMNYDRAIYYCKEVVAYLQHNPTHPSLKSCKEFIENATELSRAAELAP